MESKLLGWRATLLVAAVLVLAAGAWQILRSAGPAPTPPAATPQQIDRERAFLCAQYFRDSCFAELRKTARTARHGAGEFWIADEVYAIDYPTHPLQSHGQHHRLLVRRSDRAAYLTTAGGIDGSFEVRGPMPLAQCLQPVFGSSEVPALAGIDEDTALRLCREVLRDALPGRMRAVVPIVRAEADDGIADLAKDLNFPVESLPWRFDWSDDDRVMVHHPAGSARASGRCVVDKTGELRLLLLKGYVQKIVIHPPPDGCPSR